MSLYQGEWTGVPLFTPLKPHGEGVAVFFDGWGYCREAKMVQLKIFRAGFLPATSIDGMSSDPYIIVYCNNKIYRTVTKWGTLHPRYDESFEIDVTNPNATVGGGSGGRGRREL